MRTYFISVILSMEWDWNIWNIYFWMRRWCRSARNCSI